MEVKVIKNQHQHHAVLQEAEKLVARDPAAGSADADRLELLTVLIEDFEKRHFPFQAPDPIEAIEFRMVEQGLRQRDLVPLLGSRSRVSEVLARKRPLTVQMIRSLSIGLGIPLETLVADPTRKSVATVDLGGTLDWGKFPVREMEKRGWFSSLKVKTRGSAEEMVKAFLAQVGTGLAAQALYRRTFRGDEIDKKSYYSVLAWTARVLIRAKAYEKSVARFEPAKITPTLFRDLAQLSWFDQGPALAIEFLVKCGIILVIEPRLPNTLIDGAAMLTERRIPVIGITLRYDRIDYFWFTLLHELAHVWKHLNAVDEAFIDRLENMESTHVIEKEANRIARNALIPRAIWKRSQAFLSPTKESIQQLADNIHIHPAIVVGRLQHETGRYDSFREFLGNGSVRKAFPSIPF
ncbi:MAG: ImmA/IrrE family metallo-endopeptidase [Methylococcales bacterium]